MDEHEHHTERKKLCRVVLQLYSYKVYKQAKLNLAVQSQYRPVGDSNDREAVKVEGTGWVPLHFLAWTRPELEQALGSEHAHSPCTCCHAIKASFKVVIRSDEGQDLRHHTARRIKT